MRGPTAFRRPRWQSHSDTAIGLRGPARRSGRHDTHPMQRRGAKSFVDDLVLSRGVVLSRAAASLRSIETKPFDWQICPPRTDTSPRKARTLSWVGGALSHCRWFERFTATRALGRTGSPGSRSPSGTRVSPRFGGAWCGALGDRELFYFAKVPFPPCGLYLVSGKAGLAFPRRLKATPCRGLSSKANTLPACPLTHLGGFPVCPVKSTLRPVPPLPGLLESQAWSDDVPAIAGAVESERGRQPESQARRSHCPCLVRRRARLASLTLGEIRQSPISALFP